MLAMCLSMWQIDSTIDTWRIVRGAMATKSELCEIVAEFIANSISQEIRKHYSLVIFKYMVN